MQAVFHINMASSFPKLKRWNPSTRHAYKHACCQLLCVSFAAPLQGLHRSALRDVQGTLEQKSRALSEARQECEEGQKKLTSAEAAAAAAKQALQQEGSQLQSQVGTPLACFWTYGELCSARKPNSNASVR